MVGEVPRPIRYVRQSTAVVLTPGHQFCHKRCCNRCGMLVCSLITLCFVGMALASVDPILGAGALSIGPALIVIGIFYQRYACSVLKLQLCFTFCEAIGWMVVLTIAISWIDAMNDFYNGKPGTVSCAWELEGGRTLVGALSFAMHCVRNASEFDEVPPIGQWDGLNCSEAPFGLGNGTIPVSRETKAHNFSAEALSALLEAAEMADNSSQCEALSDGLNDAISQVEVREIAYSGKTVNTSSRSGLAGAFDELFKVEAVGTGCACMKEVHNGSTPNYDYCREGNQCVVPTGPHCNATAHDRQQRTAACTPLEPDGNVTAEFAFRRTTLTHAVITAYFRAAFLEELLKYVAVRRILFKDRVADAGGLLVYGLASAAGFATVENVEYTIDNGVFVAVSRMFVSIPLHCTTGMMIGIHLGYRKFLGEGHFMLDKFIVAMAAPVLTHGTYDFLLMIPHDTPWYSPGVGALGSFIVMLLGFIYTRYAWLRLDNVCVVHVKDLQSEGRLSKSQCCCCECDCISAACQQSDPLLPPESPVLVRRHAPYTDIDRGKDDNNENNESNETNNQLPSLLTRSFTWEFLPQAPTCQTNKELCPNCGESVRVHILYPSDCPFCAYQFPNPVKE